MIDGLVNLCGRLAASCSARRLRPLQNGMVQFYALAMVLGLLVLIGALLVVNAMRILMLVTMLLLIATVFLPLARAAHARCWATAAAALAMRWRSRWSCWPWRSCWSAAIPAADRRRSPPTDCAWLGCGGVADRHPLQHRPGRPEPVAVRPDRAADGRGRAGQLGGDPRAGSRSTTGCC